MGRRGRWGDVLEVIARARYQGTELNAIIYGCVWVVSAARAGGGNKSRRCPTVRQKGCLISHMNSIPLSDCKRSTKTDGILKYSGF